MIINKLTFNNNSEIFESTIFGEGKSHEFTLCDFGKEEETIATVLANKIFMWLVDNIDSVKKYAASDLVNLKNRTWLEEGEEPLTETKFAERIELDSILAFSEGSFQIFFIDNDIFGGHAIRIEINKDFNFNGADIAG